MRILKLRGENLASLHVPFELDLEHGRLGRSGLFAITGPTGSGKTTLLDALCLALFDTTPRLADARRDSKFGDEGLSAQSTGNLLRRDAGHGFAEVEFLGGDQRRYRARWEVHRARRRAGGRIQSPRMSLRDLVADQDLGTTNTQVKDAIEERLGLSFEQFRRSALLAQGDFAAFLKASPKERAALLERMTGTEVYARISQAAYRRAKQENEALQGLCAQRDLLSLLGEEERATLERERREAEARKAQLRAALRAAEEASATLKRRIELAGELAAAERELETCEASLAEDWVRELQRARAVEPARLALEEQRRAGSELQEVEGRRLLAREAVEQAEGREREASEHLAEASRLQEAARARREALQPELAQARALDQRVLQLTGEVEQAQRDAAARSARIAELERKEREQVEALERCTAGLAGIPEDRGLDALVEHWEALSSELLALAEELRTEAELRQRCERGTQLVAASEGELKGHREQRRLQTEAVAQAEASSPPAPSRQQDQALEAREQALRQRRELLEAKAGLSRLRERIAQARSREQEARAASQAAEAALDEARRARGSARRAVQAAELQHLLVPGEPCPLCGADGEHWSVPEPLRALAGELEQQATEAQQARDRLADQVRAAALQAERDGEAAESLEARALRLRGELLAKGEALEAELSAEALDQLGAALAADRQALDAAHRAYEAAQAASATARRELERLGAVVDAGAERLQELTQALQLRQAEHSRVLAQVLARRSGLAARLPGHEQGLDEPTGLRALLAGRCEARRVQLRDRVRWSAESVSLSRALVTLREELGRERGLSEHEAGALGKRAAELEAVRAARIRVLEGRAAAEVERELGEASGVAGEAWQQAERARGRLQEDLARAKLELGIREAALARASVRSEQAGVALRSELERLELEREELDLRSREPAWVEEAQGRKEALDQRLRELRVRADERRRQLGGVAPDALDGVEVQARLVAAEAAFREAEEASSELRLRLQRDDEARARGQEILAEIAEARARVRTWASLDSLIGSSDGNRFRVFAQGLSLDTLLWEANRHLEELVPRYRLQRVKGKDLDLQIQDTDLADELRSVASLSGGESFLVSLALALGLSTMSSSGTRVGSLFIDEGFGSLDRPSLDLALSTLEALQATGRQVGVISHVDGLGDQVGIAVRVVRDGPGRSRVDPPRQ